MKIIFTLLLIQLSLSSYSQVWVQPGATWHYEYTEDYVFCWGSDPFKYIYDGTAQKGGQQCEVFKKVQYNFDGTNLDSTATIYGYTYVSGDTVFYWHHNQFFVLFDFGAQVGDSWVISDSIESTTFYNNVCGDTSRVTVTGVGNINLDGNTYRTITLETDTLSPYTLNGTYIERFGTLYNNTYYTQHHFIFPIIDFDNCQQGSVIDWCAISFDCYHDDNFNLNPSGGCGVVLSVDENKQEPTFEIYPNPVSAILELKIANPTQNTTYQIVNSLGEIVKSNGVFNQQSSINVSDLPKGVYYISVSSQDSNKTILRFVKM